MTRRNRISWEHGDLFAVPLVDGSFGVVQAIDHWMPHWVYAAVTDQRVQTLTPGAGLGPGVRVIALVAVSDDAFESGTFPRLGPARALARREDFPDERFARSGYVSATSYSAGIVADFLSAWHGLAPWSPYKDPEYFDKLLLPGIKRTPSHGPVKPRKRKAVPQQIADAIKFVVYVAFALLAAGWVALFVLFGNR